VKPATPTPLRHRDLLYTTEAETTEDQPLIAVKSRADG
jgi:hypothetical protein